MTREPETSASRCCWERAFLLHIPCLLTGTSLTVQGCRAGAGGPKCTSAPGGRQPARDFLGQTQFPVADPKASIAARCPLQQGSKVTMTMDSTRWAGLDLAWDQAGAPLSETFSHCSIEDRAWAPS